MGISADSLGAAVHAVLFRLIFEWGEVMDGESATIKEFTASYTSRDRVVRLLYLIDVERLHRIACIQHCETVTARELPYISPRG